jgi:inosine-uridine nucleoside N-ribohydrolase
MTHKLAIVADPGIDTAFALALAMHDPQIEVLGIASTAGNIHHEQATRNVHAIVAAVDPPRWPRVATALPIDYEINGSLLHGPNGLGGVDIPTATLHQAHPADKLLVELASQYPQELTVVVLGPLTAVARALDRSPDFAAHVKQIICLGGSWHEPGNASAVSEFHFLCDPEAARQVLRSGIPMTLVPLDVMRKLIFSPTDLLELPNPDSPTCRFLRQIVPYGIRATSNLYGVEGFHLKDVLGIVSMVLPGSITTRPAFVDVELRGELTRGMSVITLFPYTSETQAPSLPTPKSERPNVELVTGVDLAAVRDYITRTLGKANSTTRDS